MLSLDLLRELNIWTILLRVVLSLIIGGVIGLERGSKNQPAGFRTYMLVCLGAAIVMMTNQYMMNVFEIGDPSRMGAQVISGIGFLGAGTIIVTRQNQVHGLTTAAGLWSAACLGLAVGVGFYEGAVIVSVVIFLIMTVFQKIEELFKGKSDYLKLYIHFSSTEAMDAFVHYCNKNYIKIVDMQISKMSDAKGQEVIGMFWLKVMKHQVRTEVMKNLGTVVGVEFMEEI